MLYGFHHGYRYTRATTAEGKKERKDQNKARIEKAAGFLVQ
jgi:hypothetical protein